MSISEFFNRKARAVIATGALALGMGGGFAAHEAVQSIAEPQVSSYTLAQIMSDERQTDADQAPRLFFPAALSPGFTPPAATLQAETDAVAGFTARIAAMQTLADRAAKTEAAVGFVNDLRVSENLSERDYAGIVKDYNTRVGLDVTHLTGNWQTGIRWQQEANLGVQFSEMFGGFFGGSDEELTPQQLSAAVGKEMKDGQTLTNLVVMGGAAAGFGLGALLLAPIWLRAGRRHPKVEGAKPSPKAAGPKPV